MVRGVRTAAGRIVPILAGLLASVAAIIAAGAPPAAGEPLPIFNPFVAFRAPSASVPASAAKSGNWFGYQQNIHDAAAAGGAPIHAVAGDWMVPSATPHRPGQAEASSDWVGIGGGCLDAACTATDNTLIQTGTEQDVLAGGATRYWAWFELVPIPAQPIPAMTVRPGDHIHASVAETSATSDTWTITIADLTGGETFSTSVPYTSGRGTAEWIEETPLRIGANRGFARLPDLTDSMFSGVTVNGAPARLRSSQRTYLATLGGLVVGSASAPTPGGGGFAACAWSSTCS